MMVRQVTESDMPEIYFWFRSRKWPYPPIEKIAPYWGFMAEKDGKPMACAFAYLTGTSLAIIDWTATNPEADESLAVKGLVDIIDRMKDIFTIEVTPKVRALVLFTQNERLAERFEKTGFKKQDEFFRCLWTI